MTIYKHAVTVIITLILLSACGGNSDDSGRPLNILFILSNDQAPDTIAAYGNDAISTPNLDALAEAGMSFTRVYNQGSWSGAVCQPSRKMIDTGRHLFHTGMDPRASERKDYPLFGETFRAAGYDTFQTGTWVHPMDVWIRSFTHGDAIYTGGMPHPHQGGQFQTEFAHFDADADADQHFQDYRADRHSSEEIADAAIEFLNGRAANDSPFLMYVAFIAPHDPRMSPDEYLAMYPPENVPLPDNYMPFHSFDQGDYYLRDEVIAGFPRSPKVVRENIADYYAMITHMDDQIGRILTALEASGQADNTLVVFTSDHGLAVGKHGLMGKQNQYDHSVRVPFILRGPGIDGSTDAPGMFYLNSIFPTVADLANVPIPGTVEAPSIVPLIDGKKETAYDSIYGSYRASQRMVTTLDYKLIYYPLIQRTQLFDVRNDPYEMNDLSKDPRYASTISDLMLELEDLKDMVGDPLENENPEESYSDFLGFIWN